MWTKVLKIIHYSSLSHIYKRLKRYKLLYVSDGCFLERGIHFQGETGIDKQVKK